MKDDSTRGEQQASAQERSASTTAPGKRNRTDAAAAPVQRSASASAPDIASVPSRAVNELVPVSSSESFVDSLISDARPVQRKAQSGAGAEDVHALAAHGTSGASESLPHLDRIQRSFGEHDVSGIKAHTDSAAGDAARGMGASAFATGDRVAFAGAPDLHTAAHEAAHVVQQRSGVQLYGGVGQVGDQYEQNADAVADAVVRGESAEHLLGDKSSAGSSSPTSAVQRFGADEHQMLGAYGSGQSVVELAPGYTLPFGDVVALAGDHFESIDQMRRFAANTKGGKESRNEIEYARIWKLTSVEKPSTTVWHDMEAREAQEKRYYTLAGRNQSHFLAPKESDRGASKAEMSGVGNDRAEIAAARFNKSIPKNAPEGYRVNHIRAIYEAFEAAQAVATGAAGLGGGGAVPTLASALATEAFACHFLTDSFAAGHVRTARHDLKAHWDPKSPMFSYNLVGLMSDLIAHDLVNRREYTVFNRRFLSSQARGIIEGEMAKKASFTLGDLVAGALHHGDNHLGVHVKAGGQDVHLLGDDQLLQSKQMLADRQEAGEDADEIRAAARSTRGLAQRAVAFGVNEVRQAHTMGFVKGANPIAVIEGYLASHEDLFAAETLVPDPTTIDTKKSPEAAWHSDSIEALFNDPVFAKGAAVFLKEQRGELEKIAEDLGKEFGGGPKEAAIKASVVKELGGNPVDLLRRAVNWTPGAAIVNTWDAKDDASDYVGTAKTKDAMGTLTYAQRLKLIKTLTEDVSEDSNPTTTSEGRPSGSILEILKTAPKDEARTIISEVGYDRIRQWISAFARPEFEALFPRDAHAPR